MAINNTQAIRSLATIETFTKSENIQNSVSAFNGSINSIHNNNIDSQKIAYAGAAIKILPILARNAPSIWRFLVATGALSGSIIAKN